MIINKGGTLVEKGLYWNPMDGQQISMREDGVLPGDDTKTYVKMSTFALLVLAPLFGMMYIIFLPLFGIGVFLISWLVPLMGTLAELAITGIKVSGKLHGRSALFSWDPSRAYFRGYRRKKKAAPRRKTSSSKAEK